jgi:predicted Fe-Mo cluster-binding NifX family protein
MIKVGITHHLGYVSPVFDVARNLLSVSIEDGQGEVRREATLEPADPFLRAQKIKDLHIDVVVCGAISRPYEMALSSKGIRVICAVCGTVEDVLSAFLNGSLGDPKFQMPGLRGPGCLRGRCGLKVRRRGGRNTD